MTSLPMVSGILTESSLFGLIQNATRLNYMENNDQSFIFISKTGSSDSIRETKIFSSPYKNMSENNLNESSPYFLLDILLFTL